MLNPNQATSDTVTKFGLVQRFDELNHMKVLRTLAHHDLDMVYDAFVNTDDPFVLVEQTPEWMTEVVRELREGQIVPAIKRVRQETGLGLKEAKWVIDTLRNSPHRADLNERELCEFNRFVKFGLAQPYTAPIVVPPLPPMTRDVWVASCLMPDMPDSSFPDSDEGNAEYNAVNNWHVEQVGAYPSGSEAWAATHPHSQMHNGVPRYYAVHCCTVTL